MQREKLSSPSEPHFPNPAAVWLILQHDCILVQQWCWKHSNTSTSACSRRCSCGSSWDKWYKNPLITGFQQTSLSASCVFTGWTETPSGPEDMLEDLYLIISAASLNQHIEVEGPRITGVNHECPGGSDTDALCTAMDALLCLLLWPFSKTNFSWGKHTST